MKPRGIAGKRDQVGLGEPADYSLFLKRADEDVHLDAIGLENIGEDRAERRSSAGKRACNRDHSAGSPGSSPKARTRREGPAVARTPIHTQFPPSLARGFKEADLEHDLLRGRNGHRVHHPALAGHAFGNLHGLVRHDRVRGEAAEHDLPLVRRHPNAGAARAGTYFLFQVISVEANVEVQHTDKPRVGVQQ
jgi:hypothetical protein